MTALPPEVQPGDEISITWDANADGTTVTVELGDAKIVTSTTREVGEGSTLPWLVAALPNILEKAYDAISEAAAHQEEA